MGRYTRQVESRLSDVGYTISDISLILGIKEDDVLRLRSERKIIFAEDPSTGRFLTSNSELERYFGKNNEESSDTNQIDSEYILNELRTDAGIPLRSTILEDNETGDEVLGDERFTVSDVSEILGISTSTIYKLNQKGILPFIKNPETKILETKKRIWISIQIVF